MDRVFANNVSGVLASSVSESATTIIVSPEQKFPTPGPNEFYALTLVGMSGSVESEWEIVHVTAKSGDQLTVVRGQEGTVAKSWNPGTKVELRLTAEGVVTPRQVRQIVGPSTIFLSNLEAVSNPITAATSVSFQILNFTSLTNVQVSAEFGSASLDGGTINYVAPLQAVADTLVVEADGAERRVTINVVMPTVSAPTAGFTFHTNKAANAIYLYIDPDTVDSALRAHSASDWQISTDPDFLTIAWQSFDDLELFDKRVLMSPGTYYFRARTKHGPFASSWSETKSITVTGTLYPFEKGRIVPFEVAPFTGKIVDNATHMRNEYFYMELRDPGYWNIQVRSIGKLSGGKIRVELPLQMPAVPGLTREFTEFPADISPDGTLCAVMINSLVSNSPYTHHIRLVIYKKTSSGWVQEFVSDPIQSVTANPGALAQQCISRPHFFDDTTVIVLCGVPQQGNYDAVIFAEYKKLSSGWGLANTTEPIFLDYGTKFFIARGSTYDELICASHRALETSSDFYGSVLILKRNANDQLEVFQRIKYLPTDYEGIDSFSSTSVAISPDRLTLAVGDGEVEYYASFPSWSGVNEHGGVRIFTRPDVSSPFVKQAEIRIPPYPSEVPVLPDDDAYMLNFGKYVEFVDNDTLLIHCGDITAGSNSHSGFFVYARSGTQWVKEQLIHTLWSPETPGYWIQERSSLFGPGPDVVLVTSTSPAAELGVATLC